MANIKISQLPAKGANLEATDLLEVSEFNGTGYVTKSITGQEIIDSASGGGGVTDVTATAPIVSTGGTTPDISMAVADAGHDGYLSSTDWNTFNDKQDLLVSATNIKTINGSSVLGSGDLVVGGSGLKGVYNIIQGQSGNVLNNRFFGTSTSFNTYTNNIIKLHPYISNYTFTISSIGIQVLTGQAGANTRILIYSNSASKPNTKLYESATINCSTSGIKTAITSFTFTAGEVYWIGFQNSFSLTSASISSVTSANLPPFIGDSASNAANIGYQTSAYSFGSAPTTMGTVTGDNTNYILLWLTIA